MIALDEDCDVFEVSTSHLQDVVRIEDSYGRAGVPSANEAQIGVCCDDVAIPALCAWVADADGHRPICISAMSSDL